MIYDYQKSLFQKISREICENGISRESIGTYNEKTLHRVLKYFFDSDSSHHEIPLGAYVADIMNANGIIEIQTSGFAAIRDRLEFFITQFPVTVVYPVIGEKRIVWIDPQDGSLSDPKKSPKHGLPIHILPELYKYSDLIGDERLRFKCVIIEAVEYKIKDGWGNDGKSGSHRFDRIPCDLIDIVDITDKSDIKSMIPFDQIETFTSKDFARKCKFSHKSSRDIGAALKFLLNIDVIERVGKVKNAFIYKIK